jgi:uncharacterized protein
MSARFIGKGDVPVDDPTLIEGLPGLGLVASIAVDRITTQLELAQVGSIDADEFPQVATYEDGQVRDLVRVYAGESPDVMTLQSDLALPTESFVPLAECVFGDLTPAFERVVLLAGIAARKESERGEVYGVATTEAMRERLQASDIQLAENVGLIGGTTGALAKYCYHNDIPTVVLLVKSHPYMPDLQAARAVIEHALEPFVEFDIDTTELEEQAEAIRQQKQQVAEQMQALRQQEQEQEGARRPAGPSMYY